MREATAGRWLCRWALAAGLAGGAALAGPTAVAGATDPACFTSPMVPTAGAAVMRLPRNFLRAGSDSVWSRDGEWVAGRDYRIDRLSGDMRLMRAIAPGETLWVHACALLEPPALEYVRQVYRPARPAGAPPESVVVPLAPVPRPGAADCAVSPGCGPAGF